ncbi:MAG: hydrogenase maturation protease [Gammaproteobacteria bacterium]|nr:hydrogenase maturation protease [Gammaproteobacteria bacterium]
MKPLVLGVGSPFAADRVGWCAVEALQSRFGDALAFECCDRPGAHLLSFLRGRPCVAIIDALLGVTAGSLHVLQPSDLARDAGTAVHGFGVADALGLAEALGDLPPRLVLIGIGVGAGEVLPEVDWDALAAQLTNLLA